VTALLLSPHNDDAALFSAFTCHAEKPHVVTVLRSANQARNGITPEEREAEDAEAMEILGCSWEQWPYPDDDPDWDEVAGALLRHADADVVYAPEPIRYGHPQHNQVGELARDVFGDRCRFYTTYVFGGGPRMAGPVEVVPTRDAILAKLQALACYRSQILKGPSRFWMMPLNEYLAG
jgi:LmbE family N-acetylglucosaminyl deacetylase